MKEITRHVCAAKINQGKSSPRNENCEERKILRLISTYFCGGGNSTSNPAKQPTKLTKTTIKIYTEQAFQLGF